VVGLFPAVKRLLEVLPTLEDKHVDGARVGNVAVLLEPLPDGVPNFLGRDVDGIQRTDFGGLCSRKFGER